MRAPLPYVRTIPRTDHGNSKQQCDFSKLPGAWNSAGSWVSPGCSFPTVAKREYLRSTPWSWYTAAKTFGIMTFGPQRSRPYQGDSYEDSEDPGHHPAKSMRRTRRRRSKDNNNNKHSNDAFCIIGDSNTRAMVSATLIMMRLGQPAMNAFNNTGGLLLNYKLHRPYFGRERRREQMEQRERELRDSPPRAHPHLTHALSRRSRPFVSVC